MDMKAKQRFAAFLSWILFTVTFTLAPLLFNYALEVLWGQSPTVLHLISDGELYLVSCAIAAHAFGDLIGQLRRADVDVIRGLWGSFVGVVVIAFSALFYSALRMEHVVQVHGHITEVLNLNQSFLLESSYTAFGGAVLLGFYTALVKEQGRGTAPSIQGPS